jgi:hypothetical protein
VLSGDRLREQPLEPVDGLHAQPDQFAAAISEQPQRLELTAGSRDAKVLGADRDHRDRVASRASVLRL